VSVVVNIIISINMLTSIVIIIIILIMIIFFMVAREWRQQGVDPRQRLVQLQHRSPGDN
jgi:preprotein translocase subunit YajC